MNISNEYQERCRFDSFCKVILHHELLDFYRRLRHTQKYESTFSDLPSAMISQSAQQKEPYIISYCGYCLEIRNDDLACAILSLPQNSQYLLILSYTAGFSDAESGYYLKMSRSAVQRLRSSTLKILRRKLEESL